MRTEDDLRAALTSLEDQAPAAARVLPSLSTCRSRPRRGMRSPLALRWVAGIAATAAVAGAITGVTLTSGSSSSIKNGPVASSKSATNTPVEAKLLAAISTTAGDIVYTNSKSVYTSPSGHTSTSEGGEVWSYPAQPSAGQQVRIRAISLNGAGHPTFDTETISKLPDPGAKPGSQVAGKEVAVYYVGKTWAQSNGEGCVGCAVSPAGQWVTQMVALIKQQHDKEIGSGMVNGHRAIEFAFPGVIVNDGSMDVWVDAFTYLPVRMTMASTASYGSSLDTIDFQFLPPTPANLAKLTTPVPAGFRKVPLADLSKPAYANR